MIKDLYSWTDFGMARELKQGEIANSFCGTPEYIAPEIVADEGHNKNADWWSLGILAYESLYGVPPFYNQNQMAMYDLIVECKLSFPKQPEISEAAKDLIKQLLTRDPAKRLGGVNDIDDIKKHPWFKDIDWAGLYEKKLEPPFKPKVAGDNWIKNFDDEFTKEEAINSYVPANMDLINKHSNDFKEFGNTVK